VSGTRLNLAERPQADGPRLDGDDRNATNPIGRRDVRKGTGWGRFPRPVLHATYKLAGKALDRLVAPSPLVRSLLWPAAVPKQTSDNTTAAAADRARVRSRPRSQQSRRN
jgi:hypothetical protein